jgi:hypothetical protein
MRRAKPPSAVSSAVPAGDHGAGAVGAFLAGKITKTLILHWTGGAWKAVPS